MNLKISENLLSTLNNRKPKLDHISSLKFRVPNDADLNNVLKDNLTVLDVQNMSFEERRNYVKTHVSGVRLDNSICSGAGNMVVPFSRFVELVENGYNIVKAELLNYELVDLEFQKKFEDEIRMKFR